MVWNGAVSVLGSARVSSASSIKTLLVHFERGRWLRVLGEFDLPRRNEKALICVLLSNEFRAQLIH
jgi:hypothetical protein